MRSMKPPRMQSRDFSVSITSTGVSGITSGSAVVRTAKFRLLTDAFCGQSKPNIRAVIWKGVIFDQQNEVATEDRPFEFFMNRFRLLEAMPRRDFTDYTGLPESVVRPRLKRH